MRIFGLHITRTSTPREEQGLLKDIHSDQSFMALYERIVPFTMVGIERCYALYRSVRYIIQNNIAGDFAECGVWKGGSSMLMALTLLQLNVGDRMLFLYDSFEGMPEPGLNDGETEKQEWNRMKKAGGGSAWCLASEEELRTNIFSTGYPSSQIMVIKGRIEDTLPAVRPNRIALLRLDTDWYASTRHELTHLFPLVQKNGIVIIDDYGAWPGSKKATDEYFSGQPVYLHRIDWTGRLLVK